LFAKNNRPKSKEKKFLPINRELNEEGYKICSNGFGFDYIIREKNDEKGEYLKIKQIMTRRNSCEGCPHKEECCKNRKQKNSYQL